MPADIEELLRRYKTLKSDRGNWESQWEDVARYMAPRRLGFIGRRQSGDRRIVPQIYHPIGIQCVQTLAAALHSLVMNPATPWLRLRFADEMVDDDPEARAWIGDLSKRILVALSSPKTTFFTHANQLLEDLAAFGTAVMYIGARGDKHLYMRTYSIGECMIAENRYGAVDTVMRESEYTVRQAVDEWGDKVSKKTMDYYDKSNYDKCIRVVHSARPRMQRDYAREDRNNMPFEICYFEVEGQHLLEETGVEEMPYVVPRWGVASGEVYGRAPAMTALPQVKVVQAVTRTILNAAEKAADPPLGVPHEGLMSPVRNQPGGLTFLKGDREIKPLPTSPNLPYTSQWLTELTNEIRTTMFVDVIQFTADFRMTATEVMQRQTERMRLLGPVLGRLESEFLNPMVERVFGILHRFRMVPPPPQQLEGQDLRIEYQSPLALAAKSQRADGLQKVLMLIEPLAKMSPDIAAQLIKPINLDILTPELFDWFGVDTKLLKTNDQMGNETQRAQMSQFMQTVMPQIIQAIKAGGGAVADVAGAGNSVAQAAQTAQSMGAQIPGLPGPQGQPGAPPGMPGGGAPVPGAPPSGGIGPGGQAPTPTAASGIGAAMRGAAGVIPQMVGNLPQLMQALSGANTKQP